ncbi:unnamed protein product [Staurois parvus]|uniref:Uncharacterized protein n=1 Tax=Staurois parvus TaxID=386267 RepID=A0ABN9EGF8_9NEOB|nr:unnamed protein product [Staurois parvus]
MDPDGTMFSEDCCSGYCYDRSFWSIGEILLFLVSRQLFHHNTISGLERVGIFL